MHPLFAKRISVIKRQSIWAVGIIAFTFGLCAADFDTFLAKKGVIYSQTGVGSPVLDLSNGFVFEGEVDGTELNSVSSVSMTSPTTQVWPIPVDTTGLVFQLKKKYSTSTKLTTTFPNGIYTFTVATLHSGTRVLSLPLPSDAYPNSPHVANWSSFQSIDAGRNLQAVWDPFAGGTVSDFVQLRIEDLQGNKVFKTPGLGKSGALNGTTTGCIISARSLNPGQTYNGILVFDKIAKLDTTTYPGALGYSAYYSETQFPVQTASVRSPTDVQSYSISKTQRYIQTNAGPAVIDATSGFRFEAKVQPDQSNSMSGASIIIPINQAQALPLSSDGVSYDLQTDFATKGAFDLAFPNGSYSLIFNTVHEGVQTVTLPLAGDRYPSIPHITSFDSAQQVLAGSNLLVSWDSWPGGGSNDFVQLRVEDHSGNKLFETPNFGKKGALDGTASSATVPAGSLVPGNSYQASVIFERIVGLDELSLDAAEGISSYIARTKFSVVTIPPDVKLYDVVKRQGFEQKSTNAPGLLSSANPYSFEATVLASSSNSINSASLRLPSGTTNVLPSLGSGAGFSLGDSSASKATFDSKYSSGAYTFTMNTAHDGAKVETLQLQGDFYPVAPRISNFQKAQAIDPAADFLIQWDPWTQGTTNDFIQFQILDLAGNVIFQTKDAGKKTALDGTVTALAIPKNTLASGVPYQGKLEFRKIVVNDSTSYAGSLGIAGYSSRTEFSLGTLVGGPALTGVQVLSSGMLQFQFNAAIGKSYRVDTSTDLISWQSGGTNAISSNPTSVSFSIDRAAKAHFYRVELLP